VTKGNVGKPREAVAGGHAEGGQPTEGCCDTQAKTRSHDTSWIAWAKLMARVGEEFSLECPNCGGDVEARGAGHTIVKKVALTGLFLGCERESATMPRQPFTLRVPFFLVPHPGD
jgi:hypothetical protein